MPAPTWTTGPLVEHTLEISTPDGEMGPFHIYTVDRDGRRELLVESTGEAGGIGCKQLVLTHMSQEMLSRLPEVDAHAAYDGLEISLAE